MGAVRAERGGLVVFQGCGAGADEGLRGMAELAAGVVRRGRFEVVVPDDTRVDAAVAGGEVEGGGAGCGGGEARGFAIGEEDDAAV